MRLIAALKCVREKSNSGETVEQSSALLAAKRRKNAAHGVSRGEKWEAAPAKIGPDRAITFKIASGAARLEGEEPI